MRERVARDIRELRREQEREGRHDPPERRLVGLDDPDTVRADLLGRFGEFFDRPVKAGITDERQHDAEMHGYLCQINMHRGLRAVEIM